MRRVLLTVHKFFPASRAGTEVLTLKIAQELISRGNQILVLTAEPPDIDASLSKASGPAIREYIFEGVNVRAVGESLRLADYTFAHEYFHPGVKKYFTQVLLLGRIALRLCRAVLPASARSGNSAPEIVRWLESQINIKQEEALAKLLSAASKQ